MSAPFPDMNTQGHASQLQTSSLLQLPQDILVAVCQHLLEVQCPTCEDVSLRASVTDHGLSPV